MLEQGVKEIAKALQSAGWAIGVKSGNKVHLSPTRSMTAIDQLLPVGATPDIHLIGVLPSDFCAFAVNDLDRAGTLIMCGTAWEYLGERLLLFSLPRGARRVFHGEIEIDSGLTLLSSDEAIDLPIDITNYEIKKFTSPNTIGTQLLALLITEGVVLATSDVPVKITVDDRAAIAVDEAVSTLKSLGKLDDLGIREAITDLIGALYRLGIKGHDQSEYIRRFINCLPETAQSLADLIYRQEARTWSPRLAPRNEFWERVDLDGSLIGQDMPAGIAPYGVIAVFSKDGDHTVTSRFVRDICVGLCSDKPLFGAFRHEVFGEIPLFLCANAPKSAFASILSGVKCSTLYNRHWVRTAPRDFRAIKRHVDATYRSIGIFIPPKPLLEHEKLADLSRLAEADSAVIVVGGNTNCDLVTGFHVLSSFSSDVHVCEVIPPLGERLLMAISRGIAVEITKNDEDLVLKTAILINMADGERHRAEDMGIRIGVSARRVFAVYQMLGDEGLVDVGKYRTAKITECGKDFVNKIMNGIVYNTKLVTEAKDGETGVYA